MSGLFSWLRKASGSARLHMAPHGAWVATHQHRKGGHYRRIATAVLESDRSAVVIYDDADGQIWVRDQSEFEDGRFTTLG